MWKRKVRVGSNLNIQKTKIMASSLIISWQIDGEKLEAMSDFIFLDSKITVDGDCNHEIKRHLLLGREAMTNLDSVLKTRDIISPTTVHIAKNYSFSSSQYGCEIWTCDLDHKEGSVLKECFPFSLILSTFKLEKTLESRLNYKGIKPVNSKGNQPWILIGRTVVEVEAPILWPPDR